MPRLLKDIAKDIWLDWGEKVNYAARPYLEALDCVSYIDDRYYEDSADSLVRYFLSNATTWRGETARRIKAELKALLGDK
jgi:hypothetical protein